ncbi:MAG: chromate transporter [Clostridia bacterium]|nr:chromate transporter [Clostridia bacterium]
MTYILMIYEVFKVGLFSVGGGLATLPFWFELAKKYPDWIAEKEITDMIAVAESTPGPIGVNMATYAGFQSTGVLGGIVATLSLILPSIIVILIVAKILKKFKDSVLVKDLFYGLRASVAGLICASTLNILLQNLTVQGVQTFSFDYKKVILFAGILLGVLKFKKHPLVYIALGAAFGVLFGL